MLCDRPSPRPDWEPSSSVTATLPGPAGRSDDVGTKPMGPGPSEHREISSFQNTGGLIVLSYGEESVQTQTLPGV